MVTPLCTPFYVTFTVHMLHIAIYMYMYVFAVCHALQNFSYERRDLYSRAILDDYLSRALNIELENKRLALIDRSNYVLTLDYTIKMLNIHERY